MAGKGNPKTGGRRPGSLNIGSRSLGRKRERVRRDAVVAIQEAMPQLRKWLSSGETWKSDGAQAARMMDALMKWVLPSYSKLDPHADQAAAAQTEAATAAPMMSPEQILEAFRTMPKAAVPNAPRDALPQHLPENIGPREEDRSREPCSIEGPRHQGIPVAGSPGVSYLPAPPPMPKRPEVGAMPKLPKVPIDAEPVDPYANSRQPTGCVSIHALPEDTPIFFQR